MKGSKIISPFSDPAFIHGSIKSGGKQAKCAPLYGLFFRVYVFVVLFISLLLRVGVGFYMFCAFFYTVSADTRRKSVLDHTSWKLTPPAVQSFQAFQDIR